MPRTPSKREASNAKTNAEMFQDLHGLGNYDRIGNLVLESQQRRKLLHPYHAGTAWYSWICRYLHAAAVQRAPLLRGLSSAMSGPRASLGGCRVASSMRPGRQADCAQRVVVLEAFIAPNA
jgi:hypothetical protein